MFLILFVAFFTALGALFGNWLVGFVVGSGLAIGFAMAGASKAIKELESKKFR